MSDKNQTRSSNNSGAIPRVHSNGRDRRKHKNQNPSSSSQHERSRNSDTRQTKNHTMGPEIQKKKHYFGFKYVDQLLLKDAEGIICELLKHKVPFKDLLNSEDLSGDYIVLLVKLLVKMSETDFSENKNAIIIMALDSKFFNLLLTYIQFLPLQGIHDKRRNTYLWNNIDEFWKNLAELCSAIIDLSPSMATENLEKLIKATSISITNFENEHKIAIKQNIKHEVDLLRVKLDECRKEIELKQQQIVSVNAKEIDDEPPNDFREISVYPTCEEVTCNNRNYLKENIIFGSYSNVNHYLDVQFRLLREDFVASLRDGILDYLDGNLKKKRNFMVRVHEKARFIGPYDVKDVLGVCVQFQNKIPKVSKKKKNINYEFSKRFMYGALVCFTEDNFKTLIFGRVIERKPELFSNGKVIVGFETNFKYECGKDYKMVECNIYFEPYYQVLKALQQLDDSHFPMQEYIVKVEQDNEPPLYLKEYEFKQTEYKIDGFKVDIWKSESWPDTIKIGLNNSQLKAFKSGLTRKFSIIQGPPGTGKTYLGLKIVKAMLVNEQLWYNRTPVLVVCYTNHALDQFLGGLLSETTRIVRVGGQSKDEKLTSFNIVEKRKLWCQNNRTTNKYMFELRREIEEIHARRNILTEELNRIVNNRCVIRFESFLSVDNDLTHSWFRKATDDELRDWLCPQMKNIFKREISTTERSIVFSGSDDDTDEDDDANDFQVDDIFQDHKHRLELRSPLIDLKSLTERLHQSNTADLFVENLIEWTEWGLSLKQEGVKYTKPLCTYMPFPHRMNFEDRWKLYFYWLQCYEDQLRKQLYSLSESYNEHYRQYTELRLIADVQMMKEMSVVGMTTTGAARLQATLKALRCKIVVVEEAAEVLEAHIIPAITNYCQQLILIGDHQQLRPSTANYYIEKNMKLGVSLFERMVLNGLHCDTLDVQHRMRPEIANLIRPAVYDDLKDHESVMNFPPVLGIDTYLYFIHHTHREDTLGDTSKINLHEATFLVRLARHLILNGYEPEDITILAAYLGQKYTIDEQKKKHSYLLKNVRVAVVDNYQGEECKIILLSLVRNNAENSIGFLKIQNRVCVALSRAKVGFYMMGNMDLLCENSTIWPKIKETLVAQNALGTTLKLRCIIHQDQVNEVQFADDFNQFNEGGCKKPCNTYLVCGHTCVSSCHIRNRDHQEYTCKQKCHRTLCDDDTHICRKLCFEECGPCTYEVTRMLPCGHQCKMYCHIRAKDYLCPTLVSTTLPCGHKCDKPCHIKVEEFQCPFPCEIRVEPCGHKCTILCHIRNDPDHLQYRCPKPCANYRLGCTTKAETHLCRRLCRDECEPCDIIVKKRRTKCVHIFEVACSKDAEGIVCKKPCRKQLECGHHCKKKCYEECGDCQVRVLKTLPKCGHQIPTKCCEPPEPARCNEQCQAQLECGHSCQKRCNQACTTKCKEIVPFRNIAECNHKFSVPCHLSFTDARGYNNEILKYCNNPCRYELKCGHLCSGNCGECFQGRIHKICLEKCNAILVCGHECESPCRSACQPCKKPCPYGCLHSKCGKVCSEPCTSCKESCNRQCEHVTCPLSCGADCIEGPCQEPCSKLLKCTHPCVGFCGDPCPPLCRICDKAQLQEIFFGTEEDIEARFVILNECGHVVEDTGMNQFINSKINTAGNESKEIVVLRCPKCNVQLNTTSRYSSFFKEAVKDITMVKQKLYGINKLNEEYRHELLQRIVNVEAKCGALKCDNLNIVKQTIELLKQRLSQVSKNKRQYFNVSVGHALTSKLEILEHIIESITKNSLKTNTQNICIEHIKYVLQILTNDIEYITNQQIIDLQFELKRFRRITQLVSMEKSVNFKYTLSKNESANNSYNSLCRYIYSIEKFSEEVEQEVVKELKSLSMKVDSSVCITDSERLEILRAMNLGKGRWFKCPNGHLYAIGDCGGAMQMSKCNECGAQIGGLQHQVLQSNRFAGEFDGAVRPAWPQTLNNMGNYYF